MVSDTDRIQNILKLVRFNDAGLVPAIAQDATSGEVLMLAWMNAETLSMTLGSGAATYFSRSRDEIWVKGETSGNTQRVRGVSIDCDGDTILLEVDQIGPACHTGRGSCFTGRSMYPYAPAEQSATKSGVRSSE
jgi:phosphoribosyl-AMP cyclohydrolase